MRPCSRRRLLAVEYVGNYTAFQQLRRMVSARRSPLSVGREAPSWSSADHNYAARCVPVAIEPEAMANRVGWRSSGNSRRKSDSVLRIAIVHPDLLGTYGDGGNGRVLACRAAWRGWPVELVLARSDKPLPTADIYCLGGGEDGPQVEAADSAVEERACSTPFDGGAAVLAVCAGFQIVGTSFPDADGQQL